MAVLFKSKTYTTEGEIYAWIDKQFLNTQSRQGEIPEERYSQDVCASAANSILESKGIFVRDAEVELLYRIGEVRRAGAYNFNTNSNYVFSKVRPVKAVLSVNNEGNSFEVGQFDSERLYFNALYQIIYNDTFIIRGNNRLQARFSTSNYKVIICLCLC